MQKSILLSGSFLPQMQGRIYGGLPSLWPVTIAGKIPGQRWHC